MEVKGSEMRKNPERLAWIILSTAFALFCFLVLSIPLGIRWYVINATQVHKTSLAAVRGTVQVQEPEADVPFAVTTTQDDVPEGSTITTDATSQAFVEFFEDSTLHLYNKTQVIIHKTQSPRFGLSSKPNTIVLEVTGGRVRIGVAPSMESPMSFQVQSPHAAVELEEDGSYSVEVSSEELHLTVRDGQAKVTAMGKVVKLGQGERTTVEIGREPLGPLPAERDLIVNGDFKEPLTTGWEAYHEQDNPDEVSGKAEIITFGDRQAVRFWRMGKATGHGETGIIQTIDKDVRDFTSLELYISVRLLDQSLAGGGHLSSEFPIIVRLEYRDPNGNDNFWTHGFYFKDPTENWPIKNGEKVPRYVWYPYESPNLMEELDVKPATITSIRVYASGWDYQSMVSQVQLLAKE
jgi:hypothetical protein